MIAKHNGKACFSGADGGHPVVKQIDRRMVDAFSQSYSWVHAATESFSWSSESIFGSFLDRGC